MEITYEGIVKYMEDYFETFNRHGQHPDTVSRMDEYYAPGFEFVPYVAQIKATKGRGEFYRIITSHPSGYEHLTPLDIVVDMKRLVVVVLIKAEVSDSKTREVLVTKHYFARYPLEIDADDTLKIAKLQLFWEVLPPGVMEIDDVFDRDRK